MNRTWILHDFEQALVSFSKTRSGQMLGAGAQGLAIANSRERNNADGRFSSCPKGAAQICQGGVAVLGKGSTNPSGLRLALADLGDSEGVK